MAVLMCPSSESDEMNEKPAASWLVRLPEVFADFSGEILATLGATTSKRLGSEYFLIQTVNPAAVRASEAAKFIHWNLPVEHSWPCNPEKMEGFIEKAAQTLAKKFGDRKPQAILIGQLDPSATNRYYKTLASNLRGRVLQVFPKLEGGGKTAEEQHSNRETLFCLVGKEGLFCGMQTPKQSNGFYPGGTKYISQNLDDTISRAGAKIAEALHYIRLYQNEPKPKSRWLELGASPGGITSELLKRGYSVTAVDRAALDPRLSAWKTLEFVKADVAEFVPKVGAKFEALLSDMNNSPREAIKQLARLGVFLTQGGLAIFTLKTTGVQTVAEINTLYRDVVAEANRAGLKLIAATHLTYNRQEFTLFFERRVG